MNKSDTKPTRFLKPAVMPFAVFVGVPCISFAVCLAIFTDWSRNRAYVPFMFLALALVFSTAYSLLASWVLAKFCPVGLSAGGVHGCTFWGRKSIVPWDEIVAVKTFALANLRWVLIYSSKQRETAWFSLFQSQPADLLDALAQFGPPDSPLLRHLNSVAKAAIK